MIEFRRRSSSRTIASGATRPLALTPERKESIQLSRYYLETWLPVLLVGLNRPCRG
jgi:hypothetical protein